MKRFLDDFSDDEYDVEPILGERFNISHDPPQY